MAVGDCLSGKQTSIYPKEPLFTKDLRNKVDKLTPKQEELETMKFKEFFDNLGHYVKIKDK